MSFWWSRLRGQDFSPSKHTLLRKALEKHFSSSSFRIGSASATGQVSDSSVSSSAKVEDLTSSRQEIFLLPLRGHDNSAKFEYGTHSCMLGMLRDQVWLLQLGVCLKKGNIRQAWESYNISNIVYKLIMFQLHGTMFFFPSNTQLFRWFQINQAPGLISELNP